MSVKKSEDLIEFGGFTSVKLTMLSEVILPFVLYIAATEENFTVGLEKYLTWKSFNFNSLYFILLYLLYITFFTWMEIGGQYQIGQDGFTYYLNSLFCLVATLSLILLLQIWTGWSAFEYIRIHHLDLAVWCAVIGIIMSFWAYYHSFTVPHTSLGPFKNSKSTSYNFFMGRELNPRLGRFDIYIWSMRMSAIAIIIILTAHAEPVLCNFQSEQFFTVLTNYCLASVYILDIIFRESCVLTTFEIQSECYGFMVGFGYFLYPFVYVVQLVYIVNNDIVLSSLQVLVYFFIAATFVSGHMYCNGVKDCFRKNPNHAKVKHIKSLNTKCGKKLMISGPWGVVRHPNYACDFIHQSAVLAYTGLSAGSIYNAVTMYMILLRLKRDNDHCERKYDSEDWSKFCSIVKYKLYPGIY